MDVNRRAWESAGEKYVREYDEITAVADNGSSLLALERELLRDVLAAAPEVIHWQSGNATDDVALVRAGARSVIGLDFSETAIRVAEQRALELGVPCRYVRTSLPGAPLADASADLVYTGKGGLIWMPDLGEWARDIARLLRPGGHLFVYDEHPAAPLWSWDSDEPRIRPDRDYFAAGHVNDSFPAGGAVQVQHTLGAIVTAVSRAGLRIVDLTEYAEPFWRMGGVTAAAWNGRLPNAYSLLARLDGDAGA
ncbi:class I SAM-dependent methyltransferase [Actinoplanes couchii]|uniref:Methyltransferase n=1 Tax=Actinoplanes couchii TaxID=403638 RepID=A0ABQ3XAJ1_9ACTN|nr:class I SAM-dependent methyltransferase [Actinoplanes couchii]MDR6324873.1 SAM-dependent methyltransferase [Actinoplanes couchii]GID55505.1 methyltransferase [Actinoplanes couchii]